MKNTLLLVPFVLLAACGDGKKEAAEQMAIPESAAPSLVVDLRPYDVPFSLDLGDPATLGADSADVKWNEEFGWVEVHAGDRFAVTISEEPADMARLKADLDRDMLQKHSIIEDGPDVLVYRSKFPDADLVFVHFVRAVTVDGRSFLVQDAQGGRFTEADIARMKGSVLVQQPA
jgi:hypothetical protein